MQISTVVEITIIDNCFQYFISFITLQQMPLHQDLLKMLYCAPVCTYQIVIGKAHVSMHLHVKSVWLNLIFSKVVYHFPEYLSHIGREFKMYESQFLKVY